MKKRIITFLSVLALAVLLCFVVACTPQTPKQTVSFETNGGTEIQSVKVDKGNCIDEPAQPTREGYTFGGWYIDSDFEDKFYFITPIGKDVTIYAKWTVNPYSIVYDLAGGKANNPTSYTIEEEIVLSEPSKTGYTFTGWTGTELTEETINVTIPKGSMGNKEYTANFKANSYKVTYDANGGTVSKTEDMATYDAEYTLVSANERSGYRFDGWTDSEGNEYVAGKWEIANDVTLVAKWTPELKYTLSSDELYYTVTGINIQKDNYSILAEYQGKPVKAIGKRAFDNCSSLTSIEIPDSVTSIREDAFWYCSSLTSVYYTGSIDQWIEIEFYVTSNPLFYAGNLYIDEKLVTEVKLTTATKINDYAFDNCDSLTSIEIPNSVTSIGDSAFYNCDSLTSVTFGENSSLTSIGERAFYYCSSLTSLTFGENSSLTSIGDSAFDNCSSLTSIEIPDSVTSIGKSAFDNCDSLTSIEIPDSVTSIGRDAFAGCDKLRIYCEVTSEPSGWYRDYYNDIMWNYDRPIVWGYAGEKGVTENGYVWALTSNNTITIAGYSSNSTELIIPEKINGYSVTSIGERAFYDCDSLTSVEIPDSVTSIGFSAFVGCDKLTIYCEVTSEPSGWSSYWKSSNCPIVWDCKNNNVANDGYVYGITIDGINYAVRYGTAKVVGTTVSGDTAIPSSIIYNSTTYEVTSIGSYAFYNCSNLTSITIPTSVTSIGEYAFYNCDNLTNIIIPDSVTSIKSYAFSNCDSLASIELSDSVTSIGSYTFNGCGGLASIEIPASVTSIGSYTFNGCDNLTIYCEVASRPSGWDSYWNYLNYGSSTSCPVVWGYKGE